MRRKLFVELSMHTDPKSCSEALQIDSKAASSQMKSKSFRWSKLLLLLGALVIGSLLLSLVEKVEGGQTSMLAQTGGPNLAGGNPSPWPLMAVVVLFGAFGGFVDGLTTDIAYRVTFGQKSFN